MGRFPLVLLEIDCRWSEAALSQSLLHLPSEIQARAARYLAPDSRRNLIASRTRLRECLQLMGLSQDSVMVAENGRPFHAQQALQFNISHSHDRAFLALSRDPALREGLGVDVEWSQRRVDAVGIGRRFFTALEYSWIGSDTTRFFRVWTRKEAIIKSNGVGLRVELDSFDVMGETVGDHVTGKRLSVHTQERSEGYLVSWAVSAAPASVTILSDTEPDWEQALGRAIGGKE